jgi:hypothetical protein
MQTRTSLVHGTGVDEASRDDLPWLRRQRIERVRFTGSQEISMTAFRERHFRPAETVKGSLTDADWVRLTKLVERARFWEMPERHDQSGLDGFDWAIEGRNNDGWAPHRGAFYELTMLLVEFSGLEIPHDVP